MSTQSTTTKEALEPCPFCGKESKGYWDGPYIHVSGAPDTLQFYSIVCNGCCSTASYETKERAIAKWNSRAPVAGVVPTVDVKDLQQQVDDLPAACEHGNLDPRDVDRLIERFAAPASTVAPQQSELPLLGYERVITVEWDKHNARRHELIEANRSRSLSEDETAELSELQWLAGIKRELANGPVVPVDQSEDWIIDPATSQAHRFQSMNGTDSCWHCDSDFGLHNAPAPASPAALQRDEARCPAIDCLHKAHWGLACPEQGCHCVGVAPCRSTR